jgi:hypothetical protein
MRTRRFLPGARGRTRRRGTDPSSNFVGLATGVSKTSTHNLAWQATT